MLLLVVFCQCVLFCLKQMERFLEVVCIIGGTLLVQERPESTDCGQKARKENGPLGRGCGTIKILAAKKKIVRHS